MSMRAMKEPRLMWHKLGTLQEPTRELCAENLVNFHGQCALLPATERINGTFKTRETPWDVIDTVLQTIPRISPNCPLFTMRCKK